MILEEWLYTRITSSTSITQYTTAVYPDFIPLNKIPPAVTYKSVGFNRNINERNSVMSITMYRNSKSEIEAINDAMYTLFDTSTAYIKETSSSLSIDSVEIINNSVSGFDDTNKYWFRVLDISVWYHK